MIPVNTANTATEGRLAPHTVRYRGLGKIIRAHRAPMMLLTVVR
jgi:hypothetical protein